MPPCLTLSIIWWGSRVEWSNSGKGVVLSPTRWCSSYWKGSLLVTLDYGRQLYFTIYIYIYILKIALKILCILKILSLLFTYYNKCFNESFFYVNITSSIFRILKMHMLFKAVFKFCTYHRIFIYIYIYIYDYRDIYSATPVRLSSLAKK